MNSSHQPFHNPLGESLDSFIRVRDEIRARLIPVVRATLGLDEVQAHDGHAETRA